MLDFIGKRPTDAQSWFQIGLNQLWQGDPDGARSCFALAVAADPSLLPALDSVGLVMRRDARPGDDDFLMGVIRLPHFANALAACDHPSERCRPARTVDGVLACLKCQENGNAGPSAGVNDDEMAKGILFALRSLMENGHPLNPSSLALSIGEAVGEALDTVKAFKQTVAKRAFRVAYQPVVDIRTGGIHHFEALCRFDAGGGTPFKAIAFAEQAGLIHEFDLAMVSLVVEHMEAARWSGQPFKVAVNVSGCSIGVASYLDGLMALLENHRWTRGHLIFEITESARMSELDTANRFIQTLRELGHDVCLDDFGAGAASFQYLSVLDVDVVKIDGSAINNARNSEKGGALLSALTDLCRRIGVETVAEMVEDPDGLTFCRECGCDYVQGYLFGRPAPAVGAFSPLPNQHLFQD